MEALWKQASRLKDQVARQGVFKQFGYGNSDNAFTDESEVKLHQRLEKLYLSTRAAKHFQRDVVRGMEGYIVTGSKQVEIGNKLSDDSQKYGVENTCTSGDTLSKAATFFGKARSQIEKERGNMLKAFGTQVAEPLRAMVMGAPLEDARHLAQRYDRMRQEAEAQKHHHIFSFQREIITDPAKPTDRDRREEDTAQIMKRPRTEQEPAGEVSLALALSLSTTDSSTTSDSTGTPSSSGAKRARRRGAVVATSGEGEFVCKTCSRAFTSFQALGGHRTSHLRGRHGLQLGVGARALKQHKQAAGSGGDKQPHQHHECHICGLGFEMGQALGGHMRRHREEMGAAEAADAWVWRTEAPRAAAFDPPVLLELFA